MKFRAFVVCAVLAIAALGTANGILWHRNDVLRETTSAEHGAAEQVSTSVAAVLSYSHSDLKAYEATVNAETTGDFRDEIIDLIDEKLASRARSHKLVTTADIQSVSTVHAEPDRVVFLLFVNQSTRSEQSPRVQFDGTRVRVTMLHRDGAWRIAELTPV